MQKQNYPVFIHTCSNWDDLSEKIKKEWRCVKSSDGFLILVLIEDGKVFFASDSLNRVLSVLEKYMGHRWMVKNNLMRKINANSTN